MAVSLVAVIGSAQATPESQDAEAVGNALQSFATGSRRVATRSATYGDLAETLPLTDLAPGDPDALDLSNLLGTYFTPANLGTFASMSDLAASIDALDDDDGPLKIQFGTDASSPIAPGAAAVTATATSITIPIAARAQRLRAARIRVRADVDAGRQPRHRPRAEHDPRRSPSTRARSPMPTPRRRRRSRSRRRRSTSAPTRPAASASSRRASASRISRSRPTIRPRGGTTENATLHACANVVFTDPDSTGGITGDEWASHALTELATAEIVDAPGTDLAATFYADASLIDGDAFTDVEAADASIAFNDDNLANGFSTPTPTLGGPRRLGQHLRRRRRQRPRPVRRFARRLAVEGERAAAVPEEEPERDVRGGEASDRLHGAADDAEVGCGTEPGDADSFPSGLTDNLAAGTLVYCRARTQLDLDDGTVAWTLPAGVSATAVSGQTSTRRSATRPRRRRGRTRAPTPSSR